MTYRREISPESSDYSNEIDNQENVDPSNIKPLSSKDVSKESTAMIDTFNRPSVNRESLSQDTISKERDINNQQSFRDYSGHITPTDNTARESIASHEEKDISRYSLGKERDIIFPREAVTRVAEESKHLSVTLQAMLDALSLQSAECQTLHGALRSGMKKQREDIEALSRCQLRLHKSVAETFRAIIGVLENLQNSHNRAEVVQGTTAKIGVVRNTSAFCVGLPELSGEALKLHNAAVARICNPEKVPSKTEDDTSNDDIGTSEIVKKIKAKGTKNEPMHHEIKHVGALLQSLVGNVSWKKAVEMVTLARQVDEKKSITSITKSSNETWTLDRLKNMLRLEKPFKPSLIGRDDHLYVDIIQEASDNYIVRAEILSFEADIFEFYEDVILTYVAPPIDIIRRALEWADKTCTKLVSLPNPASIAQNSELCSEEWFGHFSSFQLVGCIDNFKEMKALIRYIPLSGRNEKIDEAVFRAKTKDSKFVDRWWQSQTENGLWKAEVNVENDKTNAFQRSLRQVPYHVGLVETMNWLIKKCKERGIDRVGYKSRDDQLMLILNKTDSIPRVDSRKRIRNGNKTEIKAVDSAKKRKSSLPE